MQVVKRALYKDRLVTHENSSGRGSDAYRDDEGNTGSEGTDQGSSEPHTPKGWGLTGSIPALTRAGGSGASADTPHAMPWLPPLGSMGPATAGPSLELPVLNQLIDLRPLTFDDRSNDSLPGAPIFHVFVGAQTEFEMLSLQWSWVAIAIHYLYVLWSRNGEGEHKRGGPGSAFWSNYGPS